MSLIWGRSEPEEYVVEDGPGMDVDSPSMSSSMGSASEEEEYTSSDTEGVSAEGGGEPEEEVVSSLGESLEGSSKHDPTDAGTFRLLQNKQELLKQHHLKKHIKNLEGEVQKKEDTIDKLRKQSYRCQEQQAFLLGEKTYLEEVMVTSPRDLKGLMHGRISKLIFDMDAEKELEEELQVSLTKAEEELLEAQIAVGHYDHFKAKLERVGAAWTDMKERKFTDRIQAEAKLVENARKRETARQRENHILQEQTAVSMAVEEAKKASRDERVFMQTALCQHKAAKAKQAEERKKQKHLEERMKAILKLKDNIASSEGTIQARRLLKQERQRKQQLREELEKRKILEVNGIPEEHFLRKRRLLEFQAMLENYRKKKEERSVSIVEKLLREERLKKQVKRKHAHEQSEFTLRSVSRKTPKREVITAPTGSRSPGFRGKEADSTVPDEGVAEERGDVGSSGSSSPAEDMLGDCEHTLRDKALMNIVEPEIRGLWESTPLRAGHGVQLESSDKEGVDGVTRADRELAFKQKASKTEILIMKKAMEKLKGSKIQEQVAAGRKFKGKPFSSKPHVVAFRDYDIGKVYTKKVKLTNVSYTVNRIHYEGVSASIADFITVTFDPPGSMSAGMSCNMLVSFTPQVNEDFEGEVQLMSQTGPYSVPVKCLTKKCLVSLDKKELNFGTLCVRETYRQSVQVLNAGALSTEYTVTPLPQPSALCKPSGSILKQSTASMKVGESPGGVVFPDTDSDPSRLAKRSDYSIMTAVEPMKDPDTSMGEGVILPDSYANRFRSKSIGQISFVESQDVPPDKQDEQDKSEDQGKPQNKARPKSKDKSRPKSQGKSRPQSQEKKSRPSSRKTPRPKSGDKSQPDSQQEQRAQDTPCILLEKNQSDLLGQDAGQDTPQLMSQDTPQPMGQDTPQPMSQDTPQPMSQDMPQPMSQNTPQPMSQDRLRPVSQDMENQDPDTGAGKEERQCGLSEFGGVAEGKMTPAFSTGETDPKEVGPESSTLVRPSVTQQLESDLPPAFSVGGTTTAGWVPPFGSQRIELVFTPSTVGQHVSKFLITFTQPSAEPLEVTVRGCGMDVPVYVEQEVIDLRICLMDRLYQSSVVLRNRASTSIQVSFQVPADLQPYLEVLPKYGVVQGDASLTAQVKFKPLESLLEQDKYYQGSEDKWRMPVHVGVANQSRPVGFSVLAYVTPSELTFYPSSLDFACCTVHESIYCTLTVTNTSTVPQCFGFIDIPACMDVQPNDGFGELLPAQSLNLDVTFSAKKPKLYEFELVCKSGLDKTYRIDCTGRGILPPLELSVNYINFVATPLGGTSTVRVKIRNPKLSRFNSAVIRGAAPAQGPKAFQFMPLAGCPISFSPQVGVVQPGMDMDVQVQFSPRLSEESVKEEALRLSASKALEEERMKLDSEEGQRKPGGKRHKSLTTQAPPIVSSMASLASQKTDGSDSKQQVNKMALPEKGTAEWDEACRSLILSFENNCMEFTIPCFVSDTVQSDDRAPLSYRPEHNLYLQVTAPAVRPSLMLVKGQSPLVDFGSTGTGDITTQKVSVVNITSGPLKLQSSVLDPCGPFQLRNALRPVPPDGTHDLLLWFSPQVGGKTSDTLVLLSEGVQVMVLRLVGVGIHPQIDLSLGSGKNLVLDMGHVMVRDVLSKTFTLLNSSPINVRFKLTMETHAQLLKKGTTKTFRASNYSGQPPFVCVPSEGVVPSEGNKEVRVFFSPDHQSTMYSDRLLVDYNNKCGCSVLLTGKAWSNNMFLRLVSEGAMPEDFPADDKQSMIPTDLPSVAEEPSPPPTKPLLVMFTHFTGRRAGSAKQVLKREIEIGCIKSNLVKKTTGDFSIDAMPATNPFAKAFTFDVMKGSVEAGSTKTITVTFAPLKDISCSLFAANVTLTLKGHMTQVYQLLLRAMISE